MRKLYTLLTCAIAAMAIVSCSKEIENNAETPEAKLFPMTITATSTETKTELVDRVSIKWLSTDKLSVFDGAGNQEFISKGEGKTVTFSGNATGAETYYALYPYNEAATLSETTVATALPSNQEAKAGSFADGLNINASKSATTEFTFTNVLSVAKISIAAANLDGHTIKSVTLSSTYPLAGDVVVSYGENITAAAGTNAVNAITLEGDESGLSDGDYYFCLLPNAGGDITLTFTDTEGQTATKTATLSKAFSAGTIKNLGTVKGLTWSKKYSIVFGNKANSATGITSTTKATTAIASGDQFVVNQPFYVYDGNAYYGDTQTCIRLGKTKTAAKLSIELSEEGSVCAQQIIVNCAPMNENNMGGTLSVNDQNAQSVPDEAGDLVFDLGNIDITTIDLSTTKATYVYSIDVVYIEKEPVSLEFSPSTVSLTYGEEFAAPVLSSTPSGLTVSYSSSNTNVATVETTTGAVTIVAPGTTTITANFPGSDTYKSGSASYTIIVNDPNANDGSAEKPYTASEAIAIAEALEEDTIENVYVRGIVSTTGTVNTKYNSVTYYISDDGSTSHQFEIYSGLYLNGESFTDANNVRLGDYVVVCGTLKYYKQAEFDYNSQIKDILRAPTFNPDGGSFTEASQSVTISAESGAKIRYTTGETLPTSTTGTVYSGPISITETTTINALAVKDGKVSGVVSKTFTKQNSLSANAVFDYSALYSSVTSDTSLDGKSDTVDGVSIAYAKVSGNNAPKYYANGTNLRIYNESTMTITAPEGKVITAIDFSQGTTTWASGKMSGDSGSVSDSDKKWTNGSGAAQVVLTITGSFRFTKIVVTYN